MMFDYMEIEPGSCKAKSWDKIEPLMEDPDYVGERKENGWRFLMHMGGGLDRMFLTGRRVSKKTGRFSEKGWAVPMLAPPATIMKNIDYTVVDGEIMPPKGANFRDIAGIMNAEADEVQKNLARLGPPEYHLFDVLFSNGHDVREEARCSRFEILDEVLYDLWGNTPELVSLVEANSTDKMKFFEDEVNAGREGIVLKFDHAPYGEGWIKVKRLHTLDVVVTGFTDAREGKTGKFKGLIGAVKVSVFRNGAPVEVGQVSGMKDDVRIHMTTHQSEYLGRVMTIKAQEWAKDRLFHPRFKAMRDDIGPESCTWEKLMRDLEAGAGAPKDQLDLF